MAKATPGTVTFNGTTHTVSTSFPFASFYRSNFLATKEGETEKVLIKFHRTEKSASKGSWDSPEMKKGWDYLGYAEVQR